MSIDLLKIGPMVREIRQAEGVDDETVSQIAGIALSNLIDFEEGVSTLKIPDLGAVLRTVRNDKAVSAIDELFGHNEPDSWYSQEDYELGEKLVDLPFDLRQYFYYSLTTVYKRSGYAHSFSRGKTADHWRGEATLQFLETDRLVTINDLDVFDEFSQPEGKFIRVARTILGVSRERLSYAMNLSTIQAIEKEGIVNPQNLLDICTLLKLTPSEYFHRFHNVESEHASNYEAGRLGWYVTSLEAGMRKSFTGFIERLTV